MADPLSRYLEAQDPVWPRVLAELRDGRKRSHWMWFVFPQLRGLGLSANSEFFGIGGLSEAEEYARHRVLGPRLAEAGRLLLAHPRTPAATILGTVDALKLRSSATLFARAGAGPEQEELLAVFFGGVPDPRTLALLAP